MTQKERKETVGNKRRICGAKFWPATPGCDSTDCLHCSNGRGKGGNCRKSNVQYQLDCVLCPDTNTDGCIYLGQSSRNLYTRSKDHISKYESSRKQNKDDFNKKHQVDRPAQFNAKVTGVFKDCLNRQINEGVEICRVRVRLRGSG